MNLLELRQIPKGRAVQLSVSEFVPQGSAQRDTSASDIDAGIPLPDRELDRLSPIVSTSDFKTGHTFMFEGDRADAFFSIIAGSVMTYKLLANGRRQVTGFLFPGDFVGIAFNDRYAYSSEAMEPSRLCCFQQKKLQGLLPGLPGLQRLLYEAAGTELAAAQDQMVLLGRKTATERVAAFLVSMSLAALKRGRSPLALDLPMTRLDMADFLGLTRETVSRCLAPLRQAKVISTDGPNRIDILDLGQLRAFMESTDGASEVA